MYEEMKLWEFFFSNHKMNSPTYLFFVQPTPGIKEQMDDFLWGSEIFIFIVWKCRCLWSDGRFQNEAQPFSLFLKSFLRASNGLMEQNQIVYGLALAQQIPQDDILIRKAPIQ